MANFIICLLLYLPLLDFTFGFSAEAEVSITVTEGQDCLLPCSGRKDPEVMVLQRILPDQRMDLLLFRDGSVLERYEHPDYTGRVRLLDPGLLRGDLSVILKEVKVEDSGTYGCIASYKEGLVEISQTIHLTVTPRDIFIRQYRGLFSGLVVGLTVLLLIIVSRIILVRFRPLFLVRLFTKPRKRNCDSVSSTDTTSTQMSDPTHKPPLLEPLPHFIHPLLPSSSPSSTLSRSSSESALSDSDPDITDFKSYSSSPNVPFCVNQSQDHNKNI